MERSYRPGRPTPPRSGELEPDGRQLTQHCAGVQHGVGLIRGGDGGSPGGFLFFHHKGRAHAGLSGEFPGMRPGRIVTGVVEAATGSAQPSGSGQSTWPEAAYAGRVSVG